MKKEEIENELEKARHKLGTYFEWTQSMMRGEKEHKVVAMPDVLEVRIRRLDRMCGGVAVVHDLSGDWFDEPVYLDNLIAKWAVDPTVELRDAARKMRELQEEKING